MRSDQNMSFLQLVKKYLPIDDDSDDELLIEYIEDGKAYLDDIAGRKLDYAVHGLPRSLLLDYCRYARSQALEVFDHNFASDLLMLHMSQFDSLEDDEVTSDAD